MGFFKSITKAIRKVVKAPVKAVKSVIKSVSKGVKNITKSVSKGVNKIVSRNKYTIMGALGLFTGVKPLTDIALAQKMGLMDLQAEAIAQQQLAEQQQMQQLEQMQNIATPNSYYPYAYAQQTDNTDKYFKYALVLLIVVALIKR